MSVSSPSWRRPSPEEHPEMKRGEVFELVQEWLMQEDESEH